jgi:hypothetical protein
MGYFNPVPGRYLVNSSYADSVPGLISQADLINQAELLEEFKHVTGLNDIPHISLKDFPTIETLAGEHKLRREPLAAAVPQVPRYPQLQLESIAGLLGIIPKVIDKAGESQNRALDALEHISGSLQEQDRVLQNLALSARSDHARLEIANATIEVGEQRIRLASIAKEINDDTSSFILGVGAAAAAGAALVWRLTRGSWF